jgi:hypothetical protein
MTGPRPPEPASPLDRLLDVAVYGPVGLVGAVREGFPRWAEAGRRQLGARMTMARVVGRLAVDQGSRQSGDILRRVAEQADAVLTGLGLAPNPVDGRGTGSRSDSTNGSPGGAAGHAPPPGAGAGQAAPGPAPAPADGPRGSSPSGQASAGLDPAQLAIPGYDTLSASQVVQRLPGLSADELEAVRAYEAAGRARKTILLKVAQLRAGP